MVSYFLQIHNSVDESDSAETEAAGCGCRTAGSPRGLARGILATLFGFGFGFGFGAYAVWSAESTLMGAPVPPTQASA